ncbi:hypothetical protein CB1_002317010 [Camelus ferus]|nr:hypothetical protein CB1_002317010 [Camelus ferus]
MPGFVGHGKKRKASSTHQALTAVIGMDSNGNIQHLKTVIPMLIQFEKGGEKFILGDPRVVGKKSQNISRRSPDGSNVIDRPAGLMNGRSSDGAVARRTVKPIVGLF